MKKIFSIKRISQCFAWGVTFFFCHSRLSGILPKDSGQARMTDRSFLRGSSSLILMFLISIGILLSSHDMQAEEKPVPPKHPIEVISAPICMECHIDESGAALKPMKTFNHSSDFIKRHRFYASQTDHLCQACHKVSFCTDCHAYKDELKPSLKYPDEPEKWLPHRGDYLFQHRIDGRTDPASCFRCHGRQNNRKCKECHK